MAQRQSSNYLSQLILQEEKLNRGLKKIRKLRNSKNIDENKIFILFNELINNYPSNPEVLKYFLNFLQLLNDKELIKQFNLVDIGSLYKKLCATNKFDIELNMDFFHFLYNVLDDEVESLKLYKKYKRDILSSFKKFEKN